MIHIQVLGLGCPKCAKLARRADEAAQRLGRPYRLEKVGDLARILEVGVAVPALVIDGTVRSAGAVPTEEEIRLMLAALPAGQESLPEHGRRGP
jgi:small redox-active disulfide protein 2